MTTPVKDFNWACKTILELANIPSSPKLIEAMKDWKPNEQWVKGVIKLASPVIGGDASPWYFKAVEILKENGVDISLYGPYGGNV